MEITENLYIPEKSLSFNTDSYDNGKNEIQKEAELRNNILLRRFDPKYFK